MSAPVLPHAARRTVALLAVYAGELGAALTAEHRRKHICLTITIGDRTRKVFCGATPGDFRAFQNMRRDVRHAVAEIRENRA